MHKVIGGYCKMKGGCESSLEKVEFHFHRAFFVCNITKNNAITYSKKYKQDKFRYKDKYKFVINIKRNTNMNRNKRVYLHRELNIQITIA